MFRVFDNKKKKWVNDKVYLSPNPNSHLYILKTNVFGVTKLVPAVEDRYIIHKEIDIYDTDGLSIHEGDYLEASVADDRIVTGIVAYANEFASYVLLCFDSEEFFVLGSEVSDHIKIIGNVFGGYKEGKKDGNEAL